MIERSSDKSFAADAVETEFHVPADVTTMVDTMVAPNTTYFYRVQAGHGVGTSAASNIVSVTTPPAATLASAPQTTPASGGRANLALILGIAGALVVIGVVIVLLRRKGSAAG